MKNIYLKASFLICFFLFAAVYSISGQEMIYKNAKELTLIGKVLPTPEFYHRVDTARYNEMPQRVKKLFTNSSGMGITFKTNSNIISAKWTTATPETPDNMTGIVHRGLDLYIKKDGEWIFAGVGRPKENSNTVIIVENMADGEKECLLYLPLYDEVKSLEIGITKNSRIEKIPNPFRKNVLIYGSSITQGASASRPGMAYPSRMARKTGINFINWGLSGNGKMQTSVANMIAETEADAYILDCAGNPSPEEITLRTGYLVTSIRKNHPEAPIIMIQRVASESGNFNKKIRERVTLQNQNYKTEYEKLKAKGIKDLYYIEGNLLGSDHEGTTDGAHPNDIGFDRMLRIIEPAVIEILKKYGI